MDKFEQYWSTIKKFYTISNLEDLVITERRMRKKYKKIANKLLEYINIGGLPIKTVCEVINESPYFHHHAGIALNKEFMPIEMNCYHAKELGTKSDFNIITLTQELQNNDICLIEGIAGMDFEHGYIFFLPKDNFYI